MLGRALSLATVLLLVSWFAPALAQENLDAGKTPSQLFAGTCNACHKSPRGLLKTVSPSSLPGFLRQHYTTSPNMAGLLASYLVSNGATDTRYSEAPKGAKDGAKGAKEGAKEGTRQEAKQEPRPSGQPDQLDRWGRPTHRATAAPQEANAPAAEPKPEGEAGQAAVDGAAKNAKQTLSKRGRPGEMLPKEEGAKPAETAAREEAKPDAAKPAEENPAPSVKVDQPAESPVIRLDPVPQVTPAQPQTPAMAAAPATAPAAASPPASSVPAAAAAPQSAAAAIAVPPTEMAVPLPANALPPPPSVTASSAPPQPPVPPAGPPVPPISQ